jgi:septum formation protein
MHLPFVHLASQSPRRRELLAACGIQFDLVDGEVDEEDYPSSLSLYDIAQFLAEKKAEKAIRNIVDGVVIAADSLVICADRVLAKPSDRDEAFAMLRLLSGNRHDVVTGVCLRDKSKSISFSEISYVTFAELTDEDIAYYVDTYKPFDKAGAYAVQEWIGYCKIVRIEGSYTNIMGLPTERVYRELSKWIPG